MMIPRGRSEGSQESSSSARIDGPLETGMTVTVLPGASSRPLDAASSTGAGSASASAFVEAAGITGAVAGAAAAPGAGSAVGLGAGFGLG